MHEHAKKLLALGLSRVHPSIREWLSPERIDANLSEEIRDLLHARGTGSGISDPLLLESDRGEPAIFTVAESEEGGRVLCLSSPAVDDTDVGVLRRFAARAEPSFPDCSLDRLRVFQYAHAAVDLRKAPGAVPYKRLYAMPVHTLRGAPLPRHAERISAKAATDLDFYDEYHRHYLGWHRERPELAPLVRVEPRPAMQEFLDSGLLAQIFVDGRPAGIVASRRARFGPLAGYGMTEEFVYPEFRGQGLAAAVQRRYIDLLDPADEAVVFGWIHPLNVASARTAQRVGRIEVGGYVDLAIR